MTNPTSKPADKTADKTESEAAKASRTAPWSAAALKIVDDAAPTRKNTNNGDPAELVMFVDALRKSWEARENGSERGQGKSITVPEAHGKRYGNMIRKAADRVNEDDKFDIGTNVSISKPDDKGMVKV